MELFDVLKMFAALLATLALIGAAAWAARKFGMLEMQRGPAERRIKIMESVMLDPRRRLVVVRFEAKEHLLLLSPGGDQTIAAVDAKPLPAAEPQS